MRCEIINMRYGLTDGNNPTNLLLLLIFRLVLSRKFVEEIRHLSIYDQQEKR
jgi:hypothetical protein